MPKVTLDRETFKALASDTRLEILRTLDGKNLGLKEISKATNLNKATLHEHLTKLHEAGLVKRKEREGHKWVYYKLTWKGESLLHPENTRIVVLFTTTFVALWIGILQLIWYIKGTILPSGGQFLEEYGGLRSDEGNMTAPLDPMLLDQNKTATFGVGDSGNVFYQDPMFLYVALVCFLIFFVVLMVGLWRFKKNKTPKL